ncbi:MAG: class C beta-lactamase-related serine hydrolase [Gammaproteobacteria bacterium TMED112]|nr:MAG: class C beta-lactamase-related serine hydrolase [Gammaproteobacteria bacterium TMED112]|tara:strand:+ start:2868 stop:4034 length:1167 start_codon:yes stop_codon:yes gene_type:complete
MLRFLLILSISLNVYSVDKLNENVLNELSNMIMSDSATQALIVSHNGNIVLEQYGEGYLETDFVTSQSIAKAFYAVLFGVAIEKGLLKNLDQPISDYLPEWKNDKRGEITIRNLLEMKSGLYRSESWNEEMFLSSNNLNFALNVELVNEPGKVFEYNNVNTALLGPVIEQIFDDSPHEVLKKEILAPLEITEYGLWKDHSLNDITFHGIDLTPLDFVKFGQLYAQKGLWEGQQLINKTFMEQSMQPISEGPGELYGMHTSIRKMSEERRLLVKEGFNGQYLFVIPEENLVAVKFTKYLHNRENGYVISLGPMDYLLWLPFSWLKAIGEAFAGDGESDPELNDGSINMPATMSVKDKFNCPNTTTDKCPPVQRMQDLVFGLTDLNSNQE